MAPALISYSAKYLPFTHMTSSFLTTPSVTFLIARLIVRGMPHEREISLTVPVGIYPKTGRRSSSQIPLMISLNEPSPPENTR